MTAPLSVEERDHLAELLAVSAVPWLAWAVHQRDAALVAELLEPMDRQQLLALIVVLGSRVPYPRTRPDDGIVDEVAVRRAADGEVGPLTRAERVEAIRLMRRRGFSFPAIEERLHVSTATVQRALGQADDTQAVAS